MPKKLCGAAPDPSRASMRRAISAALLVVIVAGAPLAGTAQAASTSPDTATGARYRDAYRLILEERWREAITELDAFIAASPSSEWVDDAAFWRCYALERSGADPAAALDCFEKIERDHPGSEWVDDARRSVVQVARRLAREGRPEYLDRVTAEVESPGSDELLTILAALADVGDEASVTAILKRLDSATEPSLRVGIVRILEDVDSAVARTRLASLAQKDPSIEVRVEAIESLSWQKKHVDVVPLLKDLASAPGPAEVRETALEGLGDRRDPALVPFLTSLAQSEADMEVLEACLDALAMIRTGDAVDALVRLYSTRPEREVREEILDALSERTDDAALEHLIGVARTETDPELAEEAIEAIGEMKRPDVLESLLQLARSPLAFQSRAAAIEAIGEHEPARAVEALSGLLGDDMEPRLRASAAYALAETESDQAIDILVRTARDDADPTVRSAAVEALGELGTSAARNALIRLLDSRTGG